MSEAARTSIDQVSSVESYRQEPFEITGRRAMVSLGPLRGKRYCTYRCPFCYVNADYDSYGALELAQIVAWIEQQNPMAFDAIYISGDTDSFAPPRLAEGMSLLEAVSEFNKDVLFTTRAKFGVEELDRAEKVASRLRSQQRWLFGCVSIAQVSVPSLEPAPIPPAEVRARQVIEFHNRGVVSVLTLRPFLPNVPLSDYDRILDLCGSSVDVVLGGDWYADDHGVLEQAVLRCAPAVATPATRMAEMPFDSNAAMWKVHHLPTHVEFVRRACTTRGLPFFMRSEPALEYWRATNPTR